LGFRDVLFFRAVKAAELESKLEVTSSTSIDGYGSA
jgi:hypothetical protein